jgi:hypothetical protein
MSLFHLENECIKPMTTFSSFVDFCIAKQSGGVPEHQPYVILDMPAVSQAIQDRAIKAALHIFKIQYPASEMAKTGKGNHPYTGEKLNQLREALLQGAAQNNELPTKWKLKPFAKIIEQVGFLAGSAKFPEPCCGLERQGLPSCRYIESGVREAIYVKAADLLGYGLAAAMEIRSPKPDFTVHLEHIMKSITTAEQLTAFAEHGTMYKAIMRPGHYSYTPQGYFCLERTVGDASTFSIRCQPFDKTAASVAAFKGLCAAARDWHGEDHALVKFWSSLLEEL